MYINGKRVDDNRNKSLNNMIAIKSKVNPVGEFIKCIAIIILIIGLPGGLYIMAYNILHGFIICASSLIFGLILYGLGELLNLLEQIKYNTEK